MARGWRSVAVTLHIIACGRAGRTLGRLWADAGTFAIGQVLNRSLQSAAAAVEFIGQGRAVENLEPIDSEDWLMLAAPDSRLEAIAESAAAALPTRPALAFHLSGAEPADVLGAIGRPVASVHPVCPFSDPARAVGLFAGSFALGEGDDVALDHVLPAFAAIGAQTMRFRPSNKRRYHAATIAASNFLNVLDDLALRLAESAGLAPDQALKIIVSLQRAGLANIERAGPMASLTGPIERADVEVCRRLAGAVGEQEHALFMALARGTAELADRKHGRSKQTGKESLHDLFSEPDCARPGVANGGV